MPDLAFEDDRRALAAAARRARRTAAPPLSCALLEERFRAQRLSGPRSPDPLEAIRHLLATQSQELRAGRLAVRARAPGCTSAEIDGLFDEGAAIVSWFNRGTLHLVATEDYGWLHELTTLRMATSNRTWLAKAGIAEADCDRAVKLIARTLAERGPRTRAELREELERSPIRIEGQAIVHVLLAATLAGLIVRGPSRRRGTWGEQAFVLVEDWIPREIARGTAVDIAAAEAELARRYLAAHGPAGDRDLARWAGVPVGRARRGLSAIASELADAGVDASGERLVRLRSAPEPQGVPDPVLLGPFEPVLLGWDSRDEVLPPAHANRAVVGGIFRPFALVGGKAVATWKQAADSVEIDAFSRLSAADRKALERDAADIARFLTG